MRGCLGQIGEPGRDSGQAWARLAGQDGGAEDRHGPAGALSSLLKSKSQAWSS